MTRLEFIVRGLPVAQGSARAFIAGKRAYIATEANNPRSPLGAWRTAIATEARAAMGDEPLFDGPVSVDVFFGMPRPKSHYLPANNRRIAVELRPDAPLAHSGTPDLDKLSRAMLDALTNVVWRDDGQVAELRARKGYMDRPGASVRVERWGRKVLR